MFKKAAAAHSPATTSIPLHFSIFVDIAYIIGGSNDPSDGEAMSYEVTTVNIKTGEVGKAEDTLHATHAAAAASSFSKIALCGGKTTSGAFKYCQMYSPRQDKYVLCLGRSFYTSASSRVRIMIVSKGNDMMAMLKLAKRGAFPNADT